MDYTKDAVLIKALQDSSSSVETGFGASNEKQQTTSITMNTSNYLENTKSLITTILNDSLGSLSLPTLPPSPIPSLSVPFDDNLDEQSLSLNDTLEYIPYSMRPETYIVPVLFAIIFIIGVIGNGTLIVIFIKHRSMRNVPNMFIVSLAIGDLLVILFCVPFTSTVYTVDSWPYGLVVCKFSEFIKDLSQCVSVFTLTALSADRYFAIVDPMRKLTGRRATRITIISIIGIWTLSVLFALPSALYSYIRVFPEFDPEEGSGSGEGSGDDDGTGAGPAFDDAAGHPSAEEEGFGRTLQVCYPYPTEFGPVYAQVMVMFHFLVYYAVPLFFIATFYIIMARHLVLSTRNMPGEAQGQGKQIQARKKVAKMILSFVVIFAICFFPHHLFLLWFYFYPDAEDSFNDFWNFCRILGFCLSFANSCINPITLYCVSGTFRKQFNDHLFCCICDESGNRRGPGGTRQSVGGTLRGGGGGMGGGGGGLCAACVSLSGNNGRLHGADSRYGNGGHSRGDNGRLQRGSTMNSDRMMSKRKSTWDTQTTVVNHRLLNLTGNNKGANANVHVNNMCTEHEHIPLKNMTLQIPPHTKSPAAQLAQGTIISPHICTNNKHQNPASAVAVSSTTSLCSNHHGHGRKNNNTSCGNNRSNSRRRSSSCLSNKTNKFIYDNQQHRPSLNLDANYFIEEEPEKSKSSTASCNENDNNIEGKVGIEKVTLQKNHNQIPQPPSQNSPTKSSPSIYNNKVNEIFSKISQKCTSPKKVSSGGSSPSKKSSSIVNIRRSSSFTTTKTRDEQREKEVNFNNNNNYTNTKNTPTPESGEEFTETTLIQVPDSKPLGDDGGQVIICYN